VVGDRQVHPHRGQEVVEQLPADVVAAGGVHHGGEGRVVGGGLVLDEAVEQLRGEQLQLLGPHLVAAAVVELVEDVVCPSGEAVEGVHRRALGGRQQPGRQEEGL